MSQRNHGSINKLLVIFLFIPFFFASTIAYGNTVDDKRMNNFANDYLTAARYVYMEPSERDKKTSAALFAIYHGPFPAAEKAITRMLNYADETGSVEILAECRGKSMIPFLLKLADQRKPEHDVRFKDLWIDQHSWDFWRKGRYFDNYINKMQNDNIDARKPDDKPTIDRQHLFQYCTRFDKKL
jgi:hypothetical protein